MSDAVILAGVEAWRRIKDVGRRSWSDYKDVGYALQVGRAECMKIANANSPHGKRYVRLMADWLRETGFDDIQQQVRWRLLRCMDHLPEIEAWRASLPEAKRLHQNHPDSCWFGFQRISRKPGQRDYRKSKQKKLGPAPTGNLIRLVATAMREAHSQDFFIMASAVLRALDAAGLMVRSEPTKVAAPKADAPRATVHAQV